MIKSKEEGIGRKKPLKKSSVLHNRSSVDGGDGDLRKVQGHLIKDLKKVTDTDDMNELTNHEKTLHKVENANMLPKPKLRASANKLEASRKSVDSVTKNPNLVRSAKSNETDQLMKKVPDNLDDNDTSHHEMVSCGVKNQIMMNGSSESANVKIPGNDFSNTENGQSNLNETKTVIYDGKFKLPIERMTESSTNNPDDSSQLIHDAEGESEEGLIGSEFNINGSTENLNESSEDSIKKSLEMVHQNEDELVNKITENDSSEIPKNDLENIEGYANDNDDDFQTSAAGKNTNTDDSEGPSSSAIRFSENEANHEGKSQIAPSKLESETEETSESCISDGKQNNDQENSSTEGGIEDRIIRTRENSLNEKIHDNENSYKIIEVSRLKEEFSIDQELNIEKPKSGVNVENFDKMQVEVHENLADSSNESNPFDKDNIGINDDSFSIENHKKCQINDLNVETNIDSYKKESFDINNFNLEENEGFNNKKLQTSNLTTETNINVHPNDQESTTNLDDNNKANMNDDESNEVISHEEKSIATINSSEKGSLEDCEENNHDKNEGGDKEHISSKSKPRVIERFKSRQSVQEIEQKDPIKKNDSDLNRKVNKCHEQKEESTLNESKIPNEVAEVKLADKNSPTDFDSSISNIEERHIGDTSVEEVKKEENQNIRDINALKIINDYVNSIDDDRMLSSEENDSSDDNDSNFDSINFNDAKKSKNGEEYLSKESAMDLLQKNYEKYVLLHEKHQFEMCLLKLKNCREMKEIFSERYMILDGNYNKLNTCTSVPFFWLRALKCHEIVGNIIFDVDHPLLYYLTDIRCVSSQNIREMRSLLKILTSRVSKIDTENSSPNTRSSLREQFSKKLSELDECEKIDDNINESEIREVLSKSESFTLSFYFGENPFFENDILSRTYDIKMLLDTDDIMLKSIRGTKIIWKDGKNIAEKRFIKKQMNKKTKEIRIMEEIVLQESFFNFFINFEDIKGNKEIEQLLRIFNADSKQQWLIDNYNIATAIKDDIIPHATKYNFDNDQMTLVGTEYTSD